VIALMTEEAGTGRGTHSRPIRIVIADDDRDLRESLRDLLRDLGFDVCGEAKDGVEAIAAVHALAPDLVLMDIRMPRMDGLRATREIRRRYPAVQVVILSAYNDPGIQDDATEVGAASFLVKGCPASVIKRILDQAVGAADHDDASGPDTRW
jgi:DNA-binding NarL/FixJ family response regulator